jgi:hypothetical protein
MAKLTDGDRISLEGGEESRPTLAAPNPALSALCTSSGFEEWLLYPDAALPTEERRPCGENDEDKRGSPVAKGRTDNPPHLRRLYPLQEGLARRRPRTCEQMD